MLLISPQVRLGEWRSTRPALDSGIDENEDDLFSRPKKAGTVLRKEKTRSYEFSSLNDMNFFE